MENEFRNIKTLNINALCIRQAAKSAEWTEKETNTAG